MAADKESFSGEVEMEQALKGGADFDSDVGGRCSK